MKDTCFLIYQAEDFGEGSVVVAVFKDKKKADKFAEIQQALYPYDNVWVSKASYRDNSFDENTSVARYFNYQINLDEAFCLSSLDEMNEFCQEEAEPQVYTYDNYVMIYQDGDILEGYSVESYTKAREIALDYNNVLLGAKRMIQDYEVLDKRLGKG